MKVRLADIAGEARVSINTVSSILNGKETLYKPETCARIREIAIRLGYAPNLFARSLRTKRTRMLGVVARDLSFDVRTRKIAAFQKQALLKGYHMVMGLTFADHERERQVIRHFLTVCDGLVLLCDGREMDFLMERASLDTVKMAHIPYVVMDAGAGETSGIFIDRAAGIAQALGQLAGRYDRFMYCTGDPNGEEFKGQACRQVLRSLGKEGAYRPVPGKGGNPALNSEAGYEMAENILNGLSEATLVVCCDDRLALGILKRAQEVGIRVPEELGIVGYDNDRYTAFTTPALSTVVQPIEELAAKTLRYILALVDGKRFEEDCTVRTSFLPRETT